MATKPDALRSLLSHGELEPYIRHIRFPNYKNLTKNTRVDFTFPITALVGANGTNKSSVLKALFGAPGYNNLGNLWFSTSIDPIEEGADGPNCFIYGYRADSADEVVEVLKTRVRKETDPDYWEPSRPILTYGMKKMPPLPKGARVLGRSTTRWDAIEKEVEYIDFRAALSAFDKFFYHGELRNKPNTYKNKKDFIRARSPHLKRAIQGSLKNYSFRKSDRIIEKDNRKLSDDEISEISKILGREYTEILMARHKFFNCDAYTCIMKASNLSYSEAFAGSGEFAVIRLVAGVMAAKPKSLIVLDEPEVSLHPGAQERLMEFLFKAVKIKKHQIVISTHSPTIIKRLPPDAIKTFVMAPSTGKVMLPSQEALPEEAFFYLGEPTEGKITLVVEDGLAKELVLKALRLEGEAFVKLFQVRYYGGGAKTLWAHYIPIFAAENRSDVLVLFDGDNKASVEVPKPDSIPENENEKLGELIKSITGTTINFNVDGGSSGGDSSQLVRRRRSFLLWIRRFVEYLPGSGNPEDFIWTCMEQDKVSKEIKAGDAKAKFSQLTHAELGLTSHEVVSSEDILASQRRRISTIPSSNVSLKGLAALLRKFVEERNQAENI